MLGVRHGRNPNRPCYSFKAKLPRKTGITLARKPSAHLRNVQQIKAGQIPRVIYGSEMKLPYSDFTYFLRQHFDNIKDGGLDWCKKFIKADGLLFRRDGLPAALEIEQAAATLYFAGFHQDLAKSGYCDHYFFVGETFLPWLQSIDTPENGEMLDFLFSHRSNTRTSMFHFEGGKSPCLLVGSIPNKYLNSFTILVQDNQRGFFTYDKAVTKVSTESVKSLHLVFNALSYIKAFPDTVLPGLPDTVKHAPRYRNAKCFGVVPSKEIIQRDGPKPHYRTGHFRFLQSERFKHKRGMTIFVKGTFVKGRALSVLSPEEAA
jgi:hypothetical protein